MKIVVEFEFSSDHWSEYEDINPDLTMEDAIVELSEGVTYTVIRKIPSGAITFDVIEKMVLDHCMITKDQLHLKSRDMDIVDARRLCYYLSKELGLGSCRIIGQRFGNKDHATCYSAWLKATHFLQTDIEFKRKHKQFTESILNGTKNKETTNL